jgi:hypothetical protein
MKQTINFLYKKNVSVIFFIAFLIFNLYYFIGNFFSIFLNKGYNGDECYENDIYTLSNITLVKVFYSPSQPYIFITSCINFILDSPKISTRLVSLVVCILMIFYFIRKINCVNISFLEKTYKTTFFICAIFITNQMFIGTSDFLSVAFITFPILIIIQNIQSGKVNLSIKQSIIIGIFIAFSIATRPTTIVLIVSFYLALILIGGIMTVFCKEFFLIGLISIVMLSMINFIPLVQQNKIILDVKEVPKETGVDWFQRNYLMAKYWDSNKIPHTQWISTQEVIEFKKSNPNFKFPKNQIDLLIKEPGLYIRQMVRMFITALYTSYRFMYLLFPILLLSFINNKKYDIIYIINNENKINIFQNKIVVVFLFLSIIIFSFLGVKLFEFRWVLPIMILYTYFSLIYLSKFPEKYRFLVYNLSFISGILLYIFFYIRQI